MHIVNKTALPSGRLQTVPEREKNDSGVEDRVACVECAECAECASFANCMKQQHR